MHKKNQVFFNKAPDLRFHVNNRTCLLLCPKGVYIQTQARA
ncbi:unnamed protein product [Brassica rapa]|uniref:Uncharacterized protein n=1 Tax=Brassica campestris TaxID=3711 RepID=A0A8D9H529_BRACM|nr:unnamed protein product [Brassica rapa]